MPRSSQYPTCCKTYNIYDFEYDSYWHDNAYKKKVINDTKKSIKTIIARRFNNQWLGSNLKYLFTATVNHDQTLAKQALEDLGFELVHTVDNKEYIGSTVYFYKKEVKKGDSL